MASDARDDIVVELSDHEQARNMHLDQWLEEGRKLDQELHELLLRARDAGLTYREISEALNVAHPSFALYTPQKVGRMVKEAEGMARSAVGQFLHLAQHPELQDAEEGDDREEDS